MPDPSARLRAESDEKARRRDSAAEISPPPSGEETAASPIPLSHPAFWLAALVAAGCVLISVSFRLFDPDFWQHLVVGKAIWQLKGVPTTQLWSWPTYGAPDVNSSWGFRALIWPLWSALGVNGLFLWRWVTTLLAFWLLLVAARKMGAKGLTPFLVIVLASLAYRERSQIRPETLVAVLLAAQIAILETRRNTNRDLSLGLVFIAWVWANSHVSWFLGFVVIGAYLLDDALTRRGHGFEKALAPNRRKLWLMTIVALAISFVNPFGWHALWQPFDSFLHARDEPLYRTIVELQPFSWTHGWKNGLPLMIVAWPLLLVWRWWRVRFDAAETVLCVVFTWLVVGAQRFVGFYALVATPFLARDLDLVARAIPWPAWAQPPLTRASLVGAACVLIGLFEWSRPDLPLGVAIDMKQYPVRAADFIQAQGIRGKAFNHFHLGGYLLYRFWPDLERLPFMDIHQAGTRQDRTWYARAFTDPVGWKTMDGTYKFDYVVLDASQSQAEADWLKDKLDADTTWALVFLDDAAAVYLRRSGEYAPLARSREYLAIPGGEARLELLGQAAERDSMLRQLARMELQRQIHESPYNARAHSMMANLDITQGDFASARREIGESLRQDPLTFAAHERLGMMDMASGHAREALEQYETERRLTGGTPELPKRMAEAKAATRGGKPPRPGG